MISVVSQANKKSGYYWVSLWSGQVKERVTDVEISAHTATANEQIETL